MRGLVHQDTNALFVRQRHRKLWIKEQVGAVNRHGGRHHIVFNARKIQEQTGPPRIRQQHSLAEQRSILSDAALMISPI